MSTGSGFQMTGLSAIVKRNETSVPSAAQTDSGNCQSMVCSSVLIFVTVSKREPLFAKLLVDDPSEHSQALKEIDEIFARIVDGGYLALNGVDDADVKKITGSLVLGGFVDVKLKNGALVGVKPNYDKSAKSLKLNGASQKKVQALKFMIDDDENDSELMDDDDLIGEEDLKLPLSNGSNDAVKKKKRACKNCSCGLSEIEKEEELAEARASNGKVSAPKGTSACGSCSRGDAFRCASCPYLGTPAFNSAEKPEIFIKPDGSKVLLNLDDGSSPVDGFKSDSVAVNNSKVVLGDLGSI